MPYRVKLNFYEGPMDLLLFLIKKERIDVHDIPIARITEQFLAYLELIKLLDLDNIGDFLVMASTLMHIKSRMLLPPDGTAEEIEEADPREELVRRLLEYKKFKEAAHELLALKEKSKAVFSRRGAGEKEKIVVDGEEYFEASLFDLISAFRKALKDVPRKAFHEVIKDRFTVSDKVHAILHLLAQNERVSFSALLGSFGSKDEVIATFLAVLELMKIKEILVVQKDFFGEIEIIRNSDTIKKVA